MKRNMKRAAAAAITAAGLATAMTVAGPANAAVGSDLKVGGTVACPVGTAFAALWMTDNATGQTEFTNTTDHVFHYSLTFNNVSATYLKPDKGFATAVCYGPIGQIVVEYNDHTIAIAHPIIGSGWTVNVSPS